MSAKIILMYLGIVVVFMSSCSESNQQIPFKDSLSVYVEKISFERNGLFLNDIEYDTQGISFYSRFTIRDTVYSFRDIPTPFLLYKKNNSNILELERNKEVYKLDLKEEIEWSHRKYD